MFLHRPFGSTFFFYDVFFSFDYDFFSSFVSDILSEYENRFNLYSSFLYKKVWYCCDEMQIDREKSKIFEEMKIIFDPFFGKVGILGDKIKM